MEVLANLLREFRGEVFHCDPCGAELVLSDSEAALTTYATYGGYPRVPLRRRATAAAGWAFIRKEHLKDLSGCVRLDQFGNPMTKEIWTCGACFEALLIAPIGDYATFEEINRAATNLARHSQPEVVQ